MQYGNNLATTGPEQEKRDAPKDVELSNCSVMFCFVCDAFDT